MPKLKSRDRFPPGGFHYLQPESGWQAPPNASFETVVQALIQHRSGNSYLVQTHGWSIDPETVRNELDSYNARRCQQMGWVEYIYEGAPDPPVPKKAMPQPIGQRLGNVAAGAEILVEWIADGAEAVPQEVATRRASICADCPMNGKGDFSRYFTLPVSEAIRKEINRRSDMKLSTPYDERLNICEACLCPMKLKVHVPMALIRSKMDDETKSRLDPRCWITKPE